LLEAEDSEREGLGAVLEAWFSVYGTQPRTAKKVLGDKRETLMSALEELMPPNEINTKWLGKWLSKNKNRVVGGKKFVRVGSGGERGAFWKVVLVEESSAHGYSIKEGFSPHEVSAVSAVCLSLRGENVREGNEREINDNCIGWLERTTETAQTLSLAKTPCPAGRCHECGRPSLQLGFNLES
jgi:hypothetical protein